MEKATSQDIKKEAIKFSAIDAVANSKGGQALILAIKKDIASSIDELCSSFKTASHVELIGIAAQVKERVALLRTLKRASARKKIAEEELSVLLEEEQF